MMTMKTRKKGQQRKNLLQLLLLPLPPSDEISKIRAITVFTCIAASIPVTTPRTDVDADDFLTQPISKNSNWLKDCGRDDAHPPQLLHPAPNTKLDFLFPLKRTSTSAPVCSPWCLLFQHQTVNGVQPTRLSFAEQNFTARLFVYQFDLIKDAIHIPPAKSPVLRTISYPP